MDHPAIFPDASRTREPSLSLAANQRRSWLHINGMSFENRNAEQKSYREEPVRFPHGETELAGVLCLPSGAGPHPVIVYIHDSGPAGRDGYHGFPPLWQAFARRGCASLSWDKPGVGESTGDWMGQTPQDRVRECLAALTFLAQRPDIAASRIGVYGRSQAGWVIPHLMEMTDLVTCIVAVSISVASGSEQDLYRIAHQLPADGYSPDEVEKALAFTRVRADLARYRAPYERIADLQKLVEQESWFEAADGAYPAQAYAGESSATERYPRPVFSALACPILLIFGEHDTLIDVGESVETYRTEMQKIGNADVTIKIFPGADHGPFLSQTGGMREMRQALRQPEKSFPPGYLELMGDWLQQHLAPARG